MSDVSPHSAEGREHLRQYLLDTLPEAKRADLDARLNASAEWREALEAEKAALARLDALPDEAPSRDLTAAVLERTRRAPKPKAADRRLQWAMVALVLIGVMGLAAFLLPSLARTREAARRASAQNTMKQWGIVFKMYASENQDRFPPLTRYGDYWVPDVSLLYPKYISDPALMVSNRLPNAEALTNRLGALLASEPVDWDAVSSIVAESFTYPGYTMMSAADLPAVQQARTAPEAAADFAMPGVYPLREGVERFLITDINNPSASQLPQSEIPVMFENVAKVRDGVIERGANVLYLDGTVRYIPYGAGFPVTDAVADAFPTP